MEVGDQMLLAANNCSNQVGMDQFGFELQSFVALQNGPNGLQVSFGQLSIVATPGTYSICWCPVDAQCTSAEVFRAFAGQLQVDCPAGYFAIGLQPKCRVCPRGYYCPGGPPVSAQRFPCGDGLNTLNLSASASDSCICDAGFARSSATGQCTPCELGWYKSELGNDHCYQCPENYTTFSTASTNSLFCIKSVTETNADVNATDQDTEGSHQNTSHVRTVVFNVSVEGLPSDEMLQLVNELPALLLQTISEMTRLDTSIIKVEYGNTAPGPQRRLSEAISAPWIVASSVSQVSEKVCVSTMTIVVQYLNHE